MILSGTGDATGAEQFLRHAIAERPAYALAHADLSSLLGRMGRVDDALAHLDGEIDRHPESIWPLSIKVGVLEAERRTGEAIDVHRTLVTRAPHIAVLWTNYGHALQTLGEAEAARVAFRTSLQLDAAGGAAWLGLANLRTPPLDASDVAAMERALPTIGDPFQKVQLLFALGKACGDERQFERSFDYYRRANDLRGTLVPYDRDAICAAVAMNQTLGPSFYTERRGYGHDSDEVIFIVGMPRSGSSLVEQILASHPMIEGLGELFELQEVAASIGDGAGDWSRQLARLAPDQLRSMGQRYLDAVRRHRRTSRPYFTDKMPANWQYMALLHLILPNARIVDVRRDAMPCGLSAFTTHFNRQTSFPASLEDLGNYYRLYTEMADYMGETLPGRVYRLNYERLVATTEQEIRLLIDHLGLPFAASCLHFHDNRRPVHTPSAQQVRRPIDPSHLERWRNYEPWLLPLKTALTSGER